MISIFAWLQELQPSFGKPTVVGEDFGGQRPPSLKLRRAERDVAQHGLEYSSGGRGVASSNLAIPTKAKRSER